MPFHNLFFPWQHFLIWNAEHQPIQDVGHNPDLRAWGCRCSSWQRTQESPFGHHQQQQLTYQPRVENICSCIYSHHMWTTGARVFRWYLWNAEELKKAKDRDLAKRESLVKLLPVNNNEAATCILFTYNRLTILLDFQSPQWPPRLSIVSPGRIQQRFPSPRPMACGSQHQSKRGTILWCLTCYKWTLFH